MRAALQAAVSSQTEMMPSPRRSSCGERRSCHCRPWSAADSATKCSTASARSRSKRRSQSRSLPSHQPRSPLSCRVTTRTRRFTSLPSAPIGPSANCSLHCAVSFCRPAPAAAALSAKELASYLDLRAGASWTFALKATGQAVSRTTNTKVTKLGGVEWTVQVSENLLAKGAPQTAHVRAATTGIVRRESNGQEVLLVPAPLRRGQTWPAPGAQGTCTFSGFEDVTVGGQRYARCLRVEVRQAQATTVTWYAPGKGSVAFETVMNARTVAALHVTRYVPGKGRAPAIKSGPAVVGKPQPAGSPSPAGDPALKVQGSGEGSLEEANAGWFRYTSARAEDTRSSFPRSRARARARRRPGSGACGP